MSESNIYLIHGETKVSETKIERYFFDKPR